MAAVVQKSQRELETELEQLIAAGLLFRQGAPPHVTYLFKHALFRMRRMGLSCAVLGGSSMDELPMFWKKSFMKSLSFSLNF